MFREAGEVLIASSSTDLETGRAGLFKQFYALSPVEGAGRVQLHACRWVLLGRQSGLRWCLGALTTAFHCSF